MLRLTDDDGVIQNHIGWRIAVAAMTAAAAQVRLGGTGYDYMSAEVRCPDGYYLDDSA